MTKKKMFFGKQTQQHNTFIVGLSSYIDDEDDLALYFSGYNASDVKNFVKNGDLISCYLEPITSGVGSPYVSFNSYAYDNSQLVDLKYIFNNCLVFDSNALRGFEDKCIVSYAESDTIDASDDSMLVYNNGFSYADNCLMWFENALSVGRYQSFGWVENSRVYIPNYNRATFDPGSANATWRNNVNCTVYVMQDLQTLYPSAYASINKTGVTIVEILDTTKPSGVTDLSVSVLGSTSTFTFTEVLEGDFYEVWQYAASEHIWRCVGEISGNGSTTDLLTTTSGTRVKIATCDQYWNGSGFNQDQTKRAFSNEITINTEVITLTTTSTDSAWKFDYVSYPYTLTWKVTGAVTEIQTGNTPTFDFSTPGTKTIEISGYELWRITHIYCINLGITSLDVSACTGMIALRCYTNNLTSLDISACVSLIRLKVQYNNLSISQVNNIIIGFDSINPTGGTTLDYSNQSPTANPTATEHTNNDVLDAYNNQIANGTTVVGNIPS